MYDYDDCDSTILLQHNYVDSNDYQRRQSGLNYGRSWTGFMNDTNFLTFLFSQENFS